MGAAKLDGAVLITVVEHRAVVACDDDERVAVDAALAQCIGYLAHRPVKLHDDLAAQPHHTLASETLVRHTWHMHVVGAQVHKERCGAV